MVTSILANQIASFRLSRKIFRERELPYKLSIISERSRAPWIAYNSQEPLSVKLASSLINPDQYRLLLNGFHPLLLNEISSIIIIDIRNRLVLLKKKIFKFIRSSPNSTCNVHNPHGTKQLTRLRDGLSHLREHKLRHNFQDSLDKFCNCGRHTKTTVHLFLHCSNY